MKSRIRKLAVAAATIMAVAGAVALGATGASAATAAGHPGHVTTASAAASHAAVAKAAGHTAAGPGPSVPGSYTSCPASDLCFWVNANWGGDMGRFAGSNPWWGDYSQSQCRGGTWNDCASALYNNGTQDNAIVYQNINYGGQAQCIEQRTTFYSDLAHNYYDNGSGSNMNDSISSNNWTPYACS